MPNRRILHTLNPTLSVDMIPQEDDANNSGSADLKKKKRTLNKDPKDINKAKQIYWTELYTVHPKKNYFLAY